MNCKLCQKESDAYIAGQLPDDVKTQVERHLWTCNKCKEYYHSQFIIDSVISREKMNTSNPFLSTRVMAAIETTDVRRSALNRIFKPVLLTVSVAFAIYAGIMIGNLNRPDTAYSQIPVELALVDDNTIESLGTLSNE